MRIPPSSCAIGIFELRTHTQFRSRELDFTLKKTRFFSERKKSQRFGVLTFWIYLLTRFTTSILFFFIQKWSGARVCEWNREWDWETLVNAFQNIRSMVEKWLWFCCCFQILLASRRETNVRFVCVCFHTVCMGVLCWLCWLHAQ